MKTLTRNEELLLLSILNLGEDAYLVSIQDYYSKTINKQIALTTIYLPLSRLENRGMISSDLGEATAVRGGRRKRIYKLTEEGLEALTKHKMISDTLWTNYLKIGAKIK
ncbi:MAG: PadR family transcriptional regulator [bacterium]|nr:PadR family transcriptional regulator [bacterium]